MRLSAGLVHAKHLRPKGGQNLATERSCCKALQLENTHPLRTQAHSKLGTMTELGHSCWQGNDTSSSNRVTESGPTRSAFMLSLFTNSYQLNDQWHDKIRIA